MRPFSLLRHALITGTFVAMGAVATWPAHAGYSNKLHLPELGKTIELPDRIPVQCISLAADRYDVPEMALLAILRQESGGRTGIVAKNKNGSKDYGPAQFNDRSWGKYMKEKYGIPIEEITNNMCQAIVAQAYALRSEWDRCRNKGDQSIWCAVALYHSPTKKFQDIYVKGVWSQYQKIISTGKF